MAGVHLHTKQLNVKYHQIRQVREIWISKIRQAFWSDCCRAACQIPRLYVNIRIPCLGFETSSLNDATPRVIMMTSWHVNASRTCEGKEPAGVWLFFAFVSLIKSLDKQSSFRWFETPWRLCDVTLTTYRYVFEAECGQNAGHRTHCHGAPRTDQHVGWGTDGHSSGKGGVLDVFLKRTEDYRVVMPKMKPSLLS